MSSAPSDGRRCEVIDADKLAAEAGGADAICQAIDKAVTEASPGADYSIVVRVQSPSTLAATIRTGDGTVLPEQKMAVMDHHFTRSMIGDFARAIAAEVAKAR